MVNVLASANSKIEKPSMPHSKYVLQWLEEKKNTLYLYALQTTDRYTLLLYTVQSVQTYSSNHEPNVMDELQHSWCTQVLL